MKVYSIILLLGFIGVVENQAAPHAVSVASTCEKSKTKWVFVLSPEANEINRLISLVESARSAIVKRPKNDSGDVHVIVAPEDFEEFRKKSQLLKVHKWHSMQCIDPSKNLLFNDFPTSTSRSEATRKKLVKTLKCSKSWRTPSGGVARSNTMKEIDDELFKCSKMLERPSSENSTRNSTSNGVEKLSKHAKESRRLNEQTSRRNSIVPTIMRRFFVTSTSTRVPKVTTKRLNARKPTMKSRERKIDRVRKGETRPKERGNDKSSGNKNGRRESSLKERPKYSQANETGSFARKAILGRSWTNLTSTDPYSVQKASLTIPSSTESHRNSEKRGKTSAKPSNHFKSFMKAGSLNKINTTKNLPPKRTKSFEPKNTTKFVKTSTVAISQRPKWSRGPILTTKQPAGFSKSRGTKKSTIFSNTMTEKITTSLMTKDRKHKRDLAPSALGHKWRSKKLRRIKRSSWDYVKSQSDSYESSSPCHVIRMTAHCASDESVGNYENLRILLTDNSVYEPVDPFPVDLPQWPSVPGYDGSMHKISVGQSNDVTSNDVRKNPGTSEDEIYDFSPNGPNLLSADDSLYSAILQPVVEPQEKWLMELPEESSKIEDYDEYPVKFDAEDYYLMTNRRNDESLVRHGQMEKSLWQINEFSEFGEVHGSIIEDDAPHPIQISGYQSKPIVPQKAAMEAIAGTGSASLTSIGNYQDQKYLLSII